MSSNSVTDNRAIIKMGMLVRHARHCIETLSRSNGQRSWSQGRVT